MNNPQPEPRKNWRRLFDRSEDIAVIREGLDELAALWWSHCPAPGLLPARADFDLAALKPWLGWLCVYDIENGDPARLRRRLVGTRVVEMDGSDTTGLLLTDIYPARKHPNVHAAYRETLDRREPVFFQRTMPVASGTLRHLSKLTMPLASDHRTIDKFLVLLHFSNLREELARSGSLRF